MHPENNYKILFDFAGLFGQIWSHDCGGIFIGDNFWLSSTIKNCILRKQTHTHTHLRLSFDRNNNNNNGRCNNVDHHNIKVKSLLPFWPES